MRISGRVKELLCPFCGEPFKRPEDIKTGLGNVFTGGKCQCGAAYVFDRSGHNLGEAYVDALVFACDGDWEKAWTLTPDIDYKIESFHYDQGSHQLIESIKKGLRTSENLLFIKVENKSKRLPAGYSPTLLGSAGYSGRRWIKRRAVRKTASDNK